MWRDSFEDVKGEPLRRYLNPSFESGIRLCGGEGNAAAWHAFPSHTVWELFKDVSERNLCSAAEIVREKPVVVP